MKNEGASSELMRCKAAVVLMETHTQAYKLLWDRNTRLLDISIELVVVLGPSRYFTQLRLFKGGVPRAAAIRFYVPMESAIKMCKILMVMKLFHALHEILPYIYASENLIFTFIYSCDHMFDQVALLCKLKELVKYDTLNILLQSFVEANIPANGAVKFHIPIELTKPFALKALNVKARGVVGCSSGCSWNDFEILLLLFSSMSSGISHFAYVSAGRLPHRLFPPLVPGHMVEWLPFPPAVPGTIFKYYSCAMMLKDFVYFRLIFLFFNFFVCRGFTLVLLPIVRVIFVICDDAVTMCILLVCLLLLSSPFVPPVRTVLCYYPADNICLPFYDLSGNSKILLTNGECDQNVQDSHAMSTASSAVMWSSTVRAAQ
ncbi:hypothetical protein M514_20652 [Trichuris suis]|uniref:Uncharacterized protein n=1 Tax=Trichuris suis TaxID=68888 RepID=A0A085NCM0_9BILA|nr:hypothetical protein M514_20652 [Trichuris suis]